MPLSRRRVTLSKQTVTRSLVSLTRHRVYPSQLSLQNRSSVLNFAIVGTGVQPAVIIYAWNEFGEGGILAPTVGWGDMMVTTVGEVFAKKAQ